MAINSMVTESGYFNVNVTVIGSNENSPFTNNEKVLVTFARTGDKGDTGDTGPQGIQGCLLYTSPSPRDS